jgi:thioredoxin-dependent adenylylsulfate APS reductase
VLLFVRQGKEAGLATVADEAIEDAPRLEGRAPSDVLLWAAALFSPRLTFATGFGAEGCVLVDLIARHRLPIDIFTLDTGLLFPETYALWRRLEARYGVTIRAVHPVQSVAEQAAAHGERLWAHAADRCCALRKLEPLREQLGGFDAWITSIRRDQTADRAVVSVVERDPRFGIVKINPLAAWTSDDVWSYVRANDVPVNPLHAQGYPSIGCWPCTSAIRPGEDARAGRWRGHEKTECGLHARPAGRALPIHLQRP